METICNSSGSGCPRQESREQRSGSALPPSIAPSKQLGHKSVDIPLVAAACAAGGAAAMYMLDPHAGHRRRREALDRSVSLLRHIGGRAFKLASHGRDRLKGLAAIAVRRCCGGAADDQIVEARVRSALGRVVSHAHAIRVRVRQGVVLLNGPILSSEVERLVRTVRHVQGVEDVLNRLDVYDRPGEICGLQGSGRGRSDGRFIVRALSRAAAGALGGGLTLRGIRQRGRVGAALATAGVALIVSSLITRHRRQPETETDVEIDAPIEDVFDFFSDWTNFPRFLPGVSDVRESRPGRLHWVGAVSRQAPIPWDADVIEFVPNRRISWHSAPGSPVEGFGSIAFRPNGKGETRVHILLHEKAGSGAAASDQTCTCRQRAQLNERLLAVCAALEQRRTAEPVQTR